MVESYSAFDSDLEKTGLVPWLEKNNVKQCFCVGLAYDYCVGSTAEDSAKLGYATYLIDDASKSVNDATRDLMNTRLQKVGVKVISLKEFNEISKLMSVA